MSETILNTMPYFLPGGPQNLVSYSHGPTGATGIPSPSGCYFSGVWAAWYNQRERGVKYSKIPSLDYVVNVSSTGFDTEAFSEIQSNSRYRLSNLSLAFTNSGEMAFAIQDNGDTNIGFENVPKIRLSLSGNRFKMEFGGRSPALFNTMNINTPLAIPQAIDTTFRTGQLVCYYTSVDGANLYARYYNDSFETEYTIATVQSGYGNYKINHYPLSNVNPYYPYQKIMYSFDAATRSIRTFASKKTTSTAIEQIDYVTGLYFSQLTGGYGGFTRENFGAKTQGYTVFPQGFWYDEFNYPTGASPWLDINFTVYQFTSNYITGLTSGYTVKRDVYFYDDFVNYYTGQWSGFLTSGIYSTGIVISSGFTYNTGTPL